MNPIDRSHDQGRREELVRAGAQADHVELIAREERWPVPDTRAQRRARRRVLLWWALSGLSTLAMVAVFLFWPWRYVPAGSEQHDAYSLYTPLLGLAFGVAVISFAVGLVLLTKRFTPHEVAVQQRHDGAGHGSAESDVETAEATVADAATGSFFGRRSLFGRAAGVGGGVLGLGVGVVALGGLVRDPWDRGQPEQTLWHTGWAPVDGEKVYLRLDTGDPHEVVLLRPEDLDAGAVATVVPFRETERDDPEALSRAARRGDSPAMVFRVRPGTSTSGPDDTGLDGYRAYSRICTHLGCPVGMYEQQTNRLLCPCHQSQFDVTDNAKPVFGPAARSLPRLPIAVDTDGYLIATGDFDAPVGPGFWELEP